MLGPNQIKWLEALESGEWKQGRRSLRNHHNEYCCLGVAAELFLPSDDLREWDQGAGIYDGCSSVAPPYVQEALALFGCVGNGLGNDTLPPWRTSLAGQNDDWVPFKEIASTIRANPSYWFREPR